MELSSPLRWVAAIGVMFIVVVIAGSLLLNTLSDTVRLASNASEEPLDALSESGSEAASAPADDGEDGGDGDGDDEDGGDGEGDDEFPQEYTVAEGDTGAEIAEQFYGDQDGWPAIAEANDIDPGAPLRVGEELEIPAPE
jgi:nucleoid-associated protein YgaU